jgi:hypothetical protein
MMAFFTVSLNLQATAGPTPQAPRPMPKPWLSTP